MRPVIIEAALNGGTPKEQNQSCPVSPDEISSVALECIAAGATIIHNHIPDLRLTGTIAADQYAEGWKPILLSQPEAIICPTLTLASTPDEAVSHLAPCRTHGALMAPLDPGSVNLCNTGADGLPGEKRFLYVNSFELIERLVRSLGEVGLGPSIAIYEPGFLRVVLAYYRAGKLPRGTMLKFYFGGNQDFVSGGPVTDGVQPINFGLPPTPTALDAYLEMLGDAALPWAIAVPGGDSCEGELAAYALERGGHLRVGLEDFRGSGEPSNLELVERAVDLARSYGRPIATLHQAHTILDLPR